MLTAMRGHVDAVEKLLENDAPVDPSNWDHCTALHLATIHGHFEVVVALLSAGAEVDFRNSYEMTSLNIAVNTGNTGIATLLLARGALVNEQICQYDGLPESEYIDRFQRLCAKDSKNDNPEHEPYARLGLAPLHFAVAAGRPSMVGLLLSQGALVNLANTIGQRTALHFAALYGKTDAIVVLLHGGANKDLKDRWGQTARDIALQHGHVDCAQLLA